MVTGEGAVEAIVADPHMAREDKLRALERMRFEAEALQRATDEGMEGPAGDPGLRKIALAMAAVRKQH